MRIAISSTAADPKAQVDPRFGRAPFFMVYDTEAASWTAIENGGGAAGQGAGPQAVEALARAGVNLVLTGRCGPHAVTALQASGIPFLTEIGGTVESALAQYQAGH